MRNLKMRRFAYFASAAFAFCFYGSSNAILFAQESGASSSDKQAISKEAQDAIALLDSKDQMQSRLGFMRLEALREPATAETIKKYLSSQDEYVRASALRALSAVEGLKSTEVLSSCLTSDKSEHVRLHAALALEPLKDPKAYDALIKGMEDKSAEVRMASVEAFSRINEPGVIDALFVRQKQETNKEVQKVIDNAIKRIGTR
jgi:HEAT repeat protein